MKKGDLSINMIIIIAIGIVILLIMVYLVVRSSNNYNNAALCSENGGFCSSNPCERGEVIVPGINNPCGPAKFCCAVLNTNPI